MTMNFDEFNNYRYIISRHKEVVKNYFDKLVEETGIDINANEELVKQINKTDTNLQNSKRKIIRNKISCNFFTATAVIFSILLFLFLLYSFLNHTKITLANSIPQILVIVSFTALLPLFILSILLVVLIFKRRLKDSARQKEKYEQQLEKLKQQGLDQLIPLLEAIDFNTFGLLLPQTLPFIKMDQNVNLNRLDEFYTKYGFNYKSHDNSTISFASSGTIFNYPFVIANQLDMTMGKKTYEGTLTIHWTEQIYINGRSVTVSRSQVLRASVTKPCPYYNRETSIYVAHEHTPSLSYSRIPSEINGIDLGEKKYNKFLRKLEKETNKRYKEIIKINPNFQLLGNTEFEGIYGAFDRNNEVDYRILFTPLAQIQMLKLFKDRVNTFGDKYSIYKKKKITRINSDFLQEISLYDNPEDYLTYNFKQLKDNFIEANMQNFVHFYLGIAPILAVPSYTVNAPVIEPPQRQLGKPNYSFFQHEEAANCLNMRLHCLEHKMTNTPVILKTNFVNATDTTDRVNVYATSFQTVERVDYIAVYGGDGCYHNVPVYWTEYIPVAKSSTIEIKSLNKTRLSDVEKEINDTNINETAYIHNLIIKLNDSNTNVQ